MAGTSHSTSTRIARLFAILEDARACQDAMWRITTIAERAALDARDDAAARAIFDTLDTAQTALCRACDALARALILLPRETPEDFALKVEALRLQLDPELFKAEGEEVDALVAGLLREGCGVNPLRT